MSTMKFVTYNIQFGRGLDGVIDLDRIADTVRDADVIALQEVENNFPRSGNVNQVEELATRLAEHHWIYGAGVDVDADQVADDGVVVHRRQQFGNMLLSRSPIISSRVHLLPKYSSTGPLSIQRCAVEGVIMCHSRAVRVYSLHLTHISHDVRMKQLEQLLKIHQNAVTEGAPIAGDPSNTDFADQGANFALPRDAMFLGDFNFTPDQPEYDRLAGYKSDYGGRIVNPEGFVDAWVAGGNEELSGVTAERRGELVRMDYCFVSHTLAVNIQSAEIDSEAMGSDHKPFWVSFSF